MLRFAVLGINERKSFTDGGHIAFWDGWYADRETDERQARHERAEGDQKLSYFVVQNMPFGQRP